jgi:hypothetical protein
MRAKRRDQRAPLVKSSGGSSLHGSIAIRARCATIAGGHPRRQVHRAGVASEHTSAARDRSTSTSVVTFAVIASSGREGDPAVSIRHEPKAPFDDREARALLGSTATPTDGTTGP